MGMGDEASRPPEHDTGVRGGAMDGVTKIMCAFLEVCTKAFQAGRAAVDARAL